MEAENKERDIKERTFRFAVEMVRFYRRWHKQSEVLRILGQQALRSGTSIGANVQEAQAGQSQADFLSKCSIALKESRETVYWLRLLYESGECSDEQCRMLQREADEIGTFSAPLSSP